MTQQRDLSTLAVHAGISKDAFGSPLTPLYDTTTFRFDNTEALLDVVEGRKQGAFYTRYGMNPSIIALEQRLAALDAAEASLAYASGMAAISSLCLAYGRHGIVCLGEIYGGTAAFLQQQAEPLGIHSVFLPGHDLDGLEKALKQGVSLVFFETPANPTLKVIDIHAVADLSRRYGAKVAVDNTFATPVNQQVIALGADFSVQSATKYLGGHSDLTAGVLSGSREDILQLREWRKNFGQTLSPEVAHKLKRSLVTLPLRVEKHNQNAQAVAEYLTQHAAVEQVYYPGLADDPGYQLASRQMSGFGGMLSFTVNGGETQARQVIDSLKLISLAPSLGGAETLATQPVTSSHHGLSASALAQLGISGAMIRLSVGLEAVSDLIADLEQALQRVI